MREVIYVFVIVVICVSWAVGVCTGYLVKEDKTTHTLQDFLDQDQTDLIPFDREAEFMCLQFSHVLKNNAQREGFEAYTLIIDGDGKRDKHALVGIRLDGGVVFIEPQDDKVKGFLYLPGTRTLEYIERKVE